MRLIDIEPYEKHSSAHMLCVREEGKLVQVFSSDIPTIEAEPVKHGRWEWYVSPICLSGDLYYRCSVCGESDPWRMTTRGHANYCPNCGAKMDEEGEE